MSTQVPGKSKGRTFAAEHERLLALKRVRLTTIMSKVADHPSLSATNFISVVWSQMGNWMASLDAPNAHPSVVQTDGGVIQICRRDANRASMEYGRISAFRRHVARLGVRTVPVSAGSETGADLTFLTAAGVVCVDVKSFASQRILAKAAYRTYNEVVHRVPVYVAVQGWNRTGWKLYQLHYAKYMASLQPVAVGVLRG